MAEHLVTPEEGWTGIAAALGEAAAGDVVRIAAGSYRGKTTLKVPSGVSLIGHDGAALCYEGDGVAILVDRAQDVTITGLTLHGYDGMADAPLFGRMAHDVSFGLIRIVASRNISVTDSNVSAGALRRSCISVSRSEAVVVASNRATGAVVGVAYGSSEGSIDGNECSFNFQGVLLDRDPKTPTKASRANVINNRCSHNQETGIGLISSLSDTIEGNECWSNGSVGIGLSCDSRSSIEPSCAIIRHNRCHSNYKSGIVLYSSNSQAIEDNECWSNGSYGIALLRSNKHPNNPSRAIIRANRCHDNVEGGIVLFSSQSDAIEDNECWGNYSGIVLQIQTNVSNESSYAPVRNNRCYNNKKCGINLFSSVSKEIESNDCWKNGLHGILITRNPRGFNPRSHAIIRTNRIYGNGGAGICFVGSTGKTYGNRFHANRTNRVHQQYDKHIPTLAPMPDPGEDDVVDSKLDLEAPYLAPLRALLGQALPPKHESRPPYVTGLAEFLASGCSGCFRAFWIGHRNAGDGSKPEQLPDRDPRHWRLNAGKQVTFTVQQSHPDDALAGLLEWVKALRHGHRHDKPGSVQWSVLVTPDEADVDSITMRLTEQSAKHNAEGFVAGGRLMPPLIVADGPNTLRQRISAALIARQGAARARVAALLQLRSLWAMLALPTLAAAGLYLSGWHTQLWAWQTAWVGIEPLSEWKVGDWSTAVGSALVLLIALSSLINAQLPTVVRLGGVRTAPDGLEDRLKASGLSGLINRINLYALWPKRLREQRDRAIDLAWQRQLLLPQPGSVAPLILVQISGWHEGDIDWLSALGGGVVKGTALVTIMQVDGRLSLRPLFIEPEAAPWRDAFDLFLCDDEARLRINYDPATIDTSDVVAQLSPLAALDIDDAKILSTELGNDRWSPLDLLPTLPLASAPTSRVQLDRITASLALNTDLVERLLPAAADFFGAPEGTAAIEAETLNQLFRWSRTSRALRWQEVRESSQHGERLTGKVSARRRVSELMRSLWPAESDWREYMAAALRFGIWQRASDLTARLPSIGADRYALMRAMGDFDGLRFLGQEYRALLKESCAVHGTTRYAEAWAQLGSVMVTLPAAPHYETLFARYLGAEALCHGAAADMLSAQIEVIRGHVANPVALAAAPLPVLAGEAFARLSARTIIELRNMEPHSAQQRLAGHKQMLWKGLPAAIATAIDEMVRDTARGGQALSYLFANVTSDEQIEAIVRLHALTPERTLYALGYVAVSEIRKRVKGRPDAPELIAALTPVGKTLISARDSLLTRDRVAANPKLATDFARGAAGAAIGNTIVTAFLSREDAAAKLIEWMTPTRAETVYNVEARIALELEAANPEAEAADGNAQAVAAK